MRRTTTQKQIVMLFDKEITQQEGSIIKKSGSRNLYILFSYFGRRVEKSTGLIDNESNRLKVRAWLDHIMAEKRDGTLEFAKAFPGASEAEKKLFSELEGRHYAPSPKDVSIGEYIARWQVEVVPLFRTHTKQSDYTAILKAWIIPYFSSLSFQDLTRLEIQRFIATLKCKTGQRCGETVSRARAANIITVIRAIFEDACDEYHWDIADPFRQVKRHIPKTPAKQREIFCFDEWARIVEAINPWQRPMIEFMMLTGMIHSEISGLKRCDIGPNFISVHESIVRKVENDTLKTPCRGPW